MKLKFLQSGGSFQPRYSVYEPYIIPETEETSESRKSSKSKSGDDNTVEILKMIRESFKDGLPSDLQAASSTIASVFSNIEQKLNNPDLYGGTGSIARDYAKALPLLKSIEFNRKEYENAYKTLTEKGGMKEVAINSLGQIAVQSEEGFGWISPEEYHNDRESYIPITNAQLLDLRANETSLAFKNNVFETINNGVGIETITKQILEVVDKIGKEEHVRTGYGYVSGGNLLKDYKEFEKNMRQYGFDPKKDDLYSYEVSTNSERANALAMLNIVYGMLPASSKALLQYKTNGTDQGAIGMIHTLLQASSDLTLKETIKLENGVSHSSSNKKSGDSDDKYFNHAFRAIMGLGREEDFVINPGTVNKLSVRGNTVPLMVNDQKVIDKNLLSEAQNSAFGKMMDTDNISVAGQHVNASVANKIFLNSKLTTLMDLPYTLDDQGNIIPDYKLLEEKDKVDQHIKNNKWTFKDNYKQIQEFIDNNNLSIRYSPTGEVKFPNVKRFMVFNAQFPKEIFEDGKILNAKYTKELSDHDATNTYKAILQYNNWSEKDWKQNTDGFEAWDDDFYASTVVIPIKASFENMLDKSVGADTVIKLMEEDKKMRERDEKYDYDDRHIG